MRAMALRPFTTQHLNLVPVSEELDMLSKTTVFNDAQIKALPTTPLEVVPAPGVGKYLVPMLALIEDNFVASYVYDTNGDFSGAQGSTDLVITYGLNAVNAFRAVPLIYFSGLQGMPQRRVAICRPYESLSVPTVAADQLWANTFGFPFNGSDRIENNAFRLSADNNANFTGGDPANKLTVTVYYLIRVFEAL